MESDGNQLACVELVCNSIYTSPGWNKSVFNVEPYKKKVNMSMHTVAIPNIDVKFWTRKSEFPPGGLLRSLNQPKVTRHGPFELTDI